MIYKPYKFQFDFGNLNGMHFNELQKFGSKMTFSTAPQTFVAKFNKQNTIASQFS